MKMILTSALALSLLAGAASARPLFHFTTTTIITITTTWIADPTSSLPHR